MRPRKLITSLASVLLFIGIFFAQNAKPPASPADVQTTVGPTTPVASVEVGEDSGFPVQLDYRVLTLIRANLGGNTAEERANRIQQRLLAIAWDASIPIDSIVVDDRESWSEIKVDQDTLMWVTDVDAKTAGIARATLATQDAEIFRRAINRYRSEHTWRHFWRGILYTVLTTTALILIFMALAFAHRTIRSRLERWIAATGAKLKVQTSLHVPVAYVGPHLLAMLGLLRWGILAALLQVYLTIVLGYFPATREISRTFLDWIISQLSSIAQQVLAYLPNLLPLMAILILTYYLVRLNNWLFCEIGAGRMKIRGFYPDWADPTAKLIHLLILVLAAVIVFPYLPGSKSPAFQGISIFVGVLLSLGSSSAVANVVAGTILTYMRSFQVGDYVEVGSTRGEVIEKTLLVTRIRTPKKEIVTIPNGTVMSSTVTDYSAEATQQGVILHTNVTIGYDVPWRQVHELLIQAALGTTHILPEPRPFVLQTSLDDFYVSYQLNAFTDHPIGMTRTYSGLHQSIQDKFNEAGVEIMSPHYSQLRDGNRSTIPPDHLPSDYQPPAFIVREASRNGSTRRTCSPVEA